MNVLKKVLPWMMLIVLFSVSGMACAEGTAPYASQEISSSSVSLLATKKIVYSVSLVSQSHSVKVNKCDLYKETDNGWEYICSMPDAIPPRQNGDLDKSYSIASYITSSGKYQVRVSITSGSTTVYHNPSRTY